MSAVQVSLADSFAELPEQSKSLPWFAPDMCWTVDTHLWWWCGAGRLRMLSKTFLTEENQIIKSIDENEFNQNIFGLSEHSINDKIIWLSSYLYTVL